ncbi:hypothetical protein NXS19_005420 [Fusarium pseudograminearum]|nr:hypothetical protein NXS19_005420 [Fusarium pseudograminearum]
MSHEEDLIDYSDEEIGGNETAATASNGKKGELAAGNNVDKKGSYVGIHSTGFRDFLLKAELLAPSPTAVSSIHRRSNKPVSPRRSSVVTLSVRPSPVWVRQLSSFLLRFSKSSP